MSFLIPLPHVCERTQLPINPKIALTCIASLLLPSITLAADNALPLIDDPAYTQPQNMVEVAPGRKLNLYCIGTGSPTVVFEAGQGVPIAVWGYVQPEVAKTVRACSYDRAGIGFSDGTDRASTSANIADDLHRLLVAADIKPPYVLVAHSYGGMPARVFADTYPAEVVGMVLVEPSVEQQADSFRKLDLKHRTVEQWRADTIEPDLKEARECVEAAKGGIAPGTDDFRKCIARPFPQWSEAVNNAFVKNELKVEDQQASLSENESVFDISSDQVIASRHSCGDMPLIVLTRGQWAPAKSTATPEELASREARIKLWTTMHDDVAKLSTRGSNEIVEGAGHMIPFDKPQAVIDAINKVVALTAKNADATEK